MTRTALTEEARLSLLLRQLKWAEEKTAFYRTSFESDKDFKQQLDIIYDQASVKNKDLKVNASDKYLVLSTCREEDETIRANLYLRQIPDSEMSDFVAKHGKDLEYTPTR